MNGRRKEIYECVINWQNMTCFGKLFSYTWSSHTSSPCRYDSLVTQTTTTTSHTVWHYHHHHLCRLWAVFEAFHYQDDNSVKDLATFLLCLQLMLNFNAIPHSLLTAQSDSDTKLLATTWKSILSLGQNVNSRLNTLCRFLTNDTRQKRCFVIIYRSVHEALDGRGRAGRKENIIEWRADGRRLFSVQLYTDKHISRAWHLVFDCKKYQNTWPFRWESYGRTADGHLSLFTSDSNPTTTT